LNFISGLTCLVISLWIKFGVFSPKYTNMPEYRPSLNEEEFFRIEVLMKEIEDLQKKEKQLAQELRKLIYKTESR